MKKTIFLTIMAVMAIFVSSQSVFAQGASKFLKGTFVEQTEDSYATANIDLYAKTYDSGVDEIGKCYGYIEIQYPGMREGWYIVGVHDLGLEGAEPSIDLVPEMAPGDKPIKVSIEDNAAKKTLYLEGWNQDDFYPMTLKKVK